MKTRKPLVVGNWKMNGSRAANAGLLAALRASIDQPLLDRVVVAVCPSFPYIEQAVSSLAGSGILVGAQNVSSHESGAYTGEVSAAMLADIGCAFAIVGHSERRTLFGESDELIVAKSVRALACGLTVIVCVGETLHERESGLTETVLARQIEALAPLASGVAGRFVVAYEPVWAIGTGRTASPEQAQAAHAFIRARLVGAGFAADAVQILYGGSMKPSNSASLLAMPDIDGGLIGGAALVAEEFSAICRDASIG